MTKEIEIKNAPTQSQPTPPKRSDILAVGPYVGEFGWLCFTWQPLIRSIFYKNNYKRCIVFGPKGYDAFWNFAEYREIDVPKHDSQCLLWDNFNHALQAELNALGTSCFESLKKENLDFNTFWYNSLRVFNNRMLTEGCADKLIPTDKGIQFNKSEIPTITLCLRDRELAEHRNWYFEYWNELTKILCDMEYNVVTIGLVKNKTFKPDKRVKNFVNSTSINDCINILCNSDLAVGGSSGTMHLASRCGTDHIVWGNKQNEEVYNQTNWFGAYCKVITEGWKPDVDVVVKHIVDYFQTRCQK